MPPRSTNCTRVCRALADLKRLLIIDELRDGQRSVGDLAGALGISQPNVSRHLGVLRDSGFVTTERFDSSVHYALTAPKVVRSACSVSSWLEGLGPHPGHRLVERRQHTAGIDRLGDRRVGGHQPEHAGSARTTAMSARQSLRPMPTSCRALTSAAPLGLTNR